VWLVSNEPAAPHSGDRKQNWIKPPKLPGNFLPKRVGGIKLIVARELHAREAREENRSETEVVERAARAAILSSSITTSRCLTATVRSRDSPEWPNTRYEHILVGTLRNADACGDLHHV
jgi:hypothetical protein